MVKKNLLIILLLTFLTIIIVGCNEENQIEENEYYQVTFDSLGGSSVASVEVLEGNLITLPDNPVLDGYTFIGWYSDSSLSNASLWDFDSDTVSQNVTLYARWQKNFTYYQVTFDSLGGSAVESVAVIEGNPVTRPNTPVFDGYSFEGWYSDSNLNDDSLWDFSNDRVNENITLYAKWVQNEEIPVTQSLTYQATTNGYIVTGVGEETAVIIPAQYNDLPVIAIGEGAFARKDITSVVIPDSVEIIGLNAFHNCSSLTTVTISENSSLTTINNNAFSGNSSLTSIYIPKGMVNLGDDVFNNCGGLNEIVVSVENEAFYSTGNNLIEKATQTLIRGSNNSIIPDGVIIIKQAAFRRSAIATITIPASVTTIESYVFDDCINLEEIIVANNNQNFASVDGILYSKDLKTLIYAPLAISVNVNLPSSLTQIPYAAFDGREKLGSIYISKGVESISNFAFRGVNLTIYYEGSEEEWNEISKSVLWGNDNLTVVFEEQTEDVKKILIVYFSYSNNTETIANLIKNATGGDLVEIIPQIPYTASDVNYSDSTSRSQTERRNDARPEISETTYGQIDINDYSTIFIGHPIWNGYEPMIIRTLIEHYDGFTGKTVYTFSTSASSGGTTAFNSIKGRVENGVANFHSTSSQLSSGESRVNTWIESLQLPQLSNQDSAEGKRLKLSFNEKEVFITLVDNATTRDLVKKLTNQNMTLEFSDFSSSEKIASLEDTLDVTGNLGCDPVVGDLTLYIPWGNLAIFYQDSSSQSSSLVLLGKVEDSGIDLLRAETNNFTAILELV